MATIVFGLDGANWPLIEPWIDGGLLPNIERLREEGIWGISESVYPPTTCPNWKCYASSRSPAKHDIYWWERINKETFETEIPDSRLFVAPELWDYLNDSGRSVGVMNMPMSYPPRDVDEFMIAGGPPTKTDGYALPESLQNELERDGYKIHPAATIDGRSGQGVEETLELIKMRFETAERLFADRDLDFFHLTIFYINILQHHFWDGEPVKRAWQIVDEHIGHFLDEGHTIFLMSDHGCAEIQTAFHVNEWLEREGYLTVDSSLGDYLLKAGLTHERLGSLVSTLGLRRLISQTVPERLIRQFPTEEGHQHDTKFNKVNFEESIAVGSGQGLIYLLEDPNSEAYGRHREAIIDGLEALTTPHGGPVAEEIYRGEDVYPDGNPIYRPDIVFEQGAGVHTVGTVGYGQVMDGPRKWQAENIRDGLFLAHGEGVDAIGELDPLSILDIAPSILYAMGEDIPRDFEGEPVRATNSSRGDPTFRDPIPDRRDGLGAASEAARDRLADIGYLEQ
jgi:predicted AlkP superfamily phosphohydrolase/phosphomutase